jgi:hypothetical protein
MLCGLLLIGATDVATTHDATLSQPVWEGSAILAQPMMRTKTNSIAALGCAFLLLIGETVGSSCARKPMVKVIVPQDFHGAVSLSCISFDDGDRTISVGTDGHLDNVNVMCPRNSSRVEIQRNWKSVAAKGGIDWERTGDDIPVGLRFTVP